MEFQSIAQIFQRGFFRFALRSNVNLDALCDKPFAFLPHARAEVSFHDPFILSPFVAIIANAHCGIRADAYFSGYDILQCPVNNILRAAKASVPDR
jgi:hypothetical protein